MRIRHNEPRKALPVIRNDEVFIMKDKDSGLGYDAIVKRNPQGDGYDVLRPL